MINEPKMLILDEPLVNLDQDVKTSFINLLKSLHKHSKITLIMVSHDLYNMSSEFNALVHIKDKKLHTCINKDCIKEDNVSIE
jgi:zinc transport system ATP-binding protein